MRQTVVRGLAVVAVALFGGTVVACSSDGDSTAADPTTTVAEATASTAATEPDDSGAPPTVSPDEDPVPGVEWEVDEPADQGMDPAGLEAAREYAFTEGNHTQGVVVVRNGVIVGEWYDEGSDADSYAASWSMAKSFTSALVGIALDEGLIPSYEEPMTTWFPDWVGTDKATMTLRDVLEMASGLQWNEDYSPDPQGRPSDIAAVVTGEADQLTYAADRPLEVEPGTRWAYSSGDTMLLSAVLQQATGMKVSEYAKAKLFDPIGIDQVEWWEDAFGHTLTYCCLDTTSRDFARFGLLFEREGDWGGEQVVPANWVAESVAPTPNSDGYGFQWWLGGEGGSLPDDLFQAQGFDGQFIYVIPSLDLVVVRNGTYVKSPVEPVADPTLFAYYPAGGYVEGQGTQPSENGWDAEQFLRPIVESITG